MLGRSLPMKRIQLWPKKIEACIADRGAILTLAQRQNSLTYFIGFQIDRLRMRGDELNVEAPLQNFREWDLQRFQPLVPGMDVLAKVFRVKELPKICFEGIYEGGKLEAMKKRRRLRNEDPERQERRRLAKLNELKAKAAELAKKREERAEEKKRKRDEVEVEDEVAQIKKEVAEEEEAAENKGDEEEAPGETEETNLLESALDTIQDDAEEGAAKTREEAEADRRKLLAGEMLEGEADDEQRPDESDEDDYDAYTTDRGRHSLLMKHANNPAERLRDKRMLPLDEEEAEVLKKLGYSIVSDDESKVLGANLIPPWRSDRDTAEAGEDEGPPPKMKIKFLTKFDIVQLDARGRVIDRGDENFTPSKTWTGRKAGFEFKLGERGLGYYRTGAKVVVPSNTAY